MSFADGIRCRRLAGDLSGERHRRGGMSGRRVEPAPDQTLLGLLQADERERVGDAEVRGDAGLRLER